MDGPRVEDVGRNGPEESTERYIEGRRPVGRPSERWVDVVDKDANSMLECKDWRRSAEDRNDWRRRIEEDEAQVGL
jgi:hypothetical protein